VFKKLDQTKIDFFGVICRLRQIISVFFDYNQPLFAVNFDILLASLTMFHPANEELQIALIFIEDELYRFLSILFFFL